MSSIEAGISIPPAGVSLSSAMFDIFLLFYYNVFSRMLSKILLRTSGFVCMNVILDLTLSIEAKPRRTQFGNIKLHLVTG